MAIPIYNDFDEIIGYKDSALVGNYTSSSRSPYTPKPVTVKTGLKVSISKRPKGSRKNLVDIGDY